MSRGRYSGDECGGNPGYPNGVQNGRVPMGLMRRLKTQAHLGTGPGRYLVPNGAEGLDAMVAAARADGLTLRVLGGYRTYAKQVALKRAWTAQGKPEYAATPGTSNHGWGTAVDIDRRGQGTGGIVEWLQRNATRFGWDHPLWAGDGLRAEEPWHWEYIRGWRMAEEHVFKLFIDGVQVTEAAGATLEDGVTRIDCAAKGLCDALGWSITYDPDVNWTRITTTPPGE